MIKCDYPDCNLEIREEDKKLRPETAKFCEAHNQEFLALLDSDDKKKLLKFMVKTTFTR